MTKSMSHLHEMVKYDSMLELESHSHPGVRFRIRRPSFKRRSMLIGQVRELGRNLQFLDAGEGVADRIEAFHVHSKIDQLYLEWGLDSVEGLEIDGSAITIEDMLEKGPESLTREILERIKGQLSLTEDERKN